MPPRRLSYPGAVRLPHLSPSAFRTLVLVTLASLVFIIVVGAGVRLTESGLGCSTWPRCEPDSFTPRSASDSHAMVEFANRMLNAVVGLLSVAAVVGALRRQPRRADLVRWSLGLLAWVASNGLVGALVVWLHLSPVSVIAHFVLSLGAIWNAVVLYQRAGEADGVGERRRVDATDRFVTLAGADRGGRRRHLHRHPGHRQRPPRRRRAGRPARPHGGHVARVHGLSMIVFLLVTLALIRRAHRGDAGPRVVQRLHELLVVLVAQAAIGYWQYFTGVPALLVAFHVLGAALVWVAVLRVWLSLHVPVVPATEDRRRGHRRGRPGRRPSPARAATP